VETKQPSIVWKLATAAAPIAGLINLREYFTHGCVDFVEGWRNCGSLALPSLVLVEAFCFSFPIIWLLRFRKKKKESSSKPEGKP
jgi:hypothetical protein